MKKYKTILIPSHSDDWFTFRRTGMTSEMILDFGYSFDGGTGASEMGLVIGNSHYGTLMELFYNKVGLRQSIVPDSERMMHGRMLEDYIGKLWTYWNGSKEGLVENVGLDKQVRAIKRHEGFIVHPDYPYLFCSLDFKSDNTGFVIAPTNTFAVGEEIGEFPVECKTIDKFASSSLTFSIPDSYISQLHVQMMLTDSYYGEIAVLIGGNDFRVFHFERNEYHCSEILRKNTAFWEERVLPAREHLKMYHETRNEGYLAKAFALEPDPNENEAYKAILSERHQSEFTEILGTQDAYELMIKYVKTAGIRDIVKAKEAEIKNKIAHKFVQEKCDIMNFDTDGYIKYFLKKGNTNKELYLKGFKIEPSAKFKIDTEEIINNLILK